MKSLFVPATLRKHISALVAVALVATITSTAHAGTVAYTAAAIASTSTGELISTTYSGGVSNAFSSGANGYNFIYAAGSVGGLSSGGGCGSVATCAPGEDGTVGMWAIPTNTTVLGSNGAFLALDSDYNTNSSGSNHGVAVSETITGLTAGNFYTIVFNTADTQQNTFSGNTEDQVQVCLGAVCDTTPLVTDASGSDTPWVASSYTIQASAGAETLSFLGMGGTNPPGGSNVPAFALVDDLAITQTSPTPEPSSLLLLGTGLVGVARLLVRRRQIA